MDDRFRWMVRVIDNGNKIDYYPTSLNGANKLFDSIKSDENIRVLLMDRDKPSGMYGYKIVKSKGY